MSFFLFLSHVSRTIVAHHFILPFFFSTRNQRDSCSWNRELKYTFQLFKIIFLRKLGEFLFFFSFFFLSWRTVGEWYGERGGKIQNFVYFSLGHGIFLSHGRKSTAWNFFYQQLGYEIKKFKIFALVVSPFYDALVIELPGSVCF